MAHLSFLLEYDSSFGDNVPIKLTTAQKNLFPPSIVNGSIPLLIKVTRAGGGESNALVTSELGFINRYSDGVWHIGLNASLHVIYGVNPAFDHIPPLGYAFLTTTDQSNRFYDVGDLFECDVDSVFWTNFNNTEEL